jgi:hypothetical protein
MSNFLNGLFGNKWVQYASVLIIILVGLYFAREVGEEIAQ